MNGFPTGVSSKPIDVTSGARAFMQSAVEARLNEIKTSEERISKDKEMVLKALSVKALPELAMAQRERYTKEIEDYRQKVIDKWKTGGKDLPMKDQMEIQDGFLTLNNRMAAEAQELKQYDQAQKLLLDPRVKDYYDTTKLEGILKDSYSSLMEGKGIGDLNAKLFAAQIPLATTDIVFKRYSNDIKGLDKYVKGEWKDRNTFMFTNAEDEAEVDAVVDYTFQRDPDLKRRDTPEERLRVKNALIQANQDFKTYNPTSGSGSGNKYEPYVNTTPFDDKVGDKDVTVNSSVSLTDTSAFASGKRKVAPEAIEYHNAAKSEEAYRKAALKYYEKEGLNLTTAKKLIDEQVKKNLIVDKKFIPYFEDGDVVSEPFVKVQYPEKPEVDFSDLTTLLSSGAKTVVDYIPYSDQSVKNALGGKLGAKREKVFGATESLRGQSSAPKEKTESVEEVERKEPKTGKIYIFDAKTKKFIREK